MKLRKGDESRHCHFVSSLREKAWIFGIKCDGHCSILESTLYQVEVPLPTTKTSLLTVFTMNGF